MKKALAVALMLALCSSIPAQNTRMEELCVLCDECFRNEQYDWAEPFVDEMRLINSHGNNDLGKATYHYYHGSMKLGQNDLVEAMRSLFVAEQTLAPMPEDESTLQLRVRTMISLGVCYFKSQLIPDAYQCFQKGVELNERLNSSELNAMLKTDISQVYLAMNDAHKALETNKELLADTAISPMRKSNPSIVVSELYIHLNEYDSASMYLDTARLYAVSVHDKMWITMLQAEIKGRTGHIEEAIDMQLSTLDTLKKHPNPELKLQLLERASSLFYQTGDLEKALEYCEMAVETIDENPLLLHDTEVYKLKADILKEMEIKAQYQKERLLLVMALIVLVATVVVVLLLLKRKSILLQNKEMKEELLSKELDQRNRELTAKALAGAAEGKSLEDFDYYFVQTHPDFYNNLRADFPNLTPYEMRLCAYLRLNLSTKDIATIGNISFDSARVARHRLRKTLGIAGKDENLVQFLSKY